MAISVTVDLVDNGQLAFSVNDTGQPRWEATRTALVRGLTDGSDRQSATCLVRAMAAVLALYPVGTLYDPRVPQCILRGYRNLGVAENSDAVRVELSYGSFPAQEGSGAAFSPWTIEDDSEVELVETQIDPVLNVPIEISWTSKTEKIGPELVTFHSPRTIRRVVISAVINRRLVDLVTTLENRVNQFKFDDDAPGWWRCSGVFTETALGSSFWKTKVTIDTRGDQDWATYALLKYRGKHYADAKSVKDLRSRPYRYGVNLGNGCAKGCLYKTADFNKALGINRWSDLYPRNAPHIAGGGRGFP